MLKISAPLESNGRSNGTPYTVAEQTLALDVSKAVLTATNHKMFTDSISDDITNALAEVASEGNKTDVPGICRAVYKKVEAAKLADESTIKAFPKVNAEGDRDHRDFTSVNLLFRKAFTKCGFDANTVNSCFPAYHKGAKKKTA